jgi:hypothetical protein
MRKGCGAGDAGAWGMGQRAWSMRQRAWSSGHGECIMVIIVLYSH